MHFLLNSNSVKFWEKSFVSVSLMKAILVNVLLEYGGVL